ncbi:MAG: GTPase HflX [Elusimicrobia bacterium]|nr:GTPase HflX [Elusimicrobiota bacterium]
MIKKEKALLIGVNANTKNNFDNSIEELKQLAYTRGIITTKTVLQNKKSPDSKFFIGSGKVLEIKKICESENIDIVIFDDNLTPTQQKNLENIIDVKVIDRTRLILDIFAQRARTQEAKLQIELAEKNYNLSRLTGKEKSMAQQVGNIGVRAGFGEKKIEIDRRKIRDRISYLKKEIGKIKCHREIQRSRRHEVPIPIVSLVGYTNAGKSTLLNHLTKKNNVYADDRLFSTLDATTRKVKLLSQRWVLFTDTVGFIKKLPHQLIAAFKSTIEEITESDLIVHLIDISNPNHNECESIVLSVLKEIGADNLPILNVYNKCDIVEIKNNNTDNYINISASTGFGVDRLLYLIDKQLEAKLEYRKISVPYKSLSIINKLKSVSKILKYKSFKNCTELEILIDKKNWGQIEKYLSHNI